MQGIQKLGSEVEEKLSIGSSEKSEEEKQVSSVEINPNGEEKPVEVLGMSRTQIDNYTKLIFGGKKKETEASGANNNVETNDTFQTPIPEGATEEEKNKLLLNSKNDQEVLSAVTFFRKLSSQEVNPPIQQIVNHQIVPRLIELLKSKSSAVQLESCWILTNICSSTSDHVDIVLKAGALPELVDSLQNSDHEDVKEQVIWALGNIAGDSPQTRDYVLSHNVLPSILKVLSETPKLSILRNATWTLSNLCRGKPQPNFNIVSLAIPTLAKLIYSTDEEVLIDALWALSYLTDGTNDRIQSVLDAGVARRLVELLMHQSFSVVTPSLRTIGNIVTGDDQQTQCMINCGLLPCLLALLSSPKNGIKKEACWTISNITAGNYHQIQSVMDANIIPGLIRLAGGTFDVAKEALWALANALTGANATQTKAMISLGCVPALCNALNFSDTRIIQVVLDGLEHLLQRASDEGTLQIESCGGLDILEGLQTHQDHNIYQKAVHILERYFDAEDQPNELQPTDNEGANNNEKITPKKAPKS